MIITPFISLLLTTEFFWPLEIQTDQCAITKNRIYNQDGTEV